MLNVTWFLTALVTGCCFCLIRGDASAAPAEASDASLRVWYRFDEMSGGVAHDSSGNGFHASVSGTSSLLWDQEGAIQGCLSNDVPYRKMYISVPTEAFASMDQQGTIAFWVQVTGLEETKPPGGWFAGAKAGGSAVLNAHLYLDGAKWYVPFVIGGSPMLWWYEYGSVVSPGQWHHLAFTLDTITGIKKVYLNGLPAMAGGTSESDSLADISAFNIFSRNSSSTGGDWWDSFHGKIDDFRIYDRSLDADEIWSLANPADINRDHHVDFEDVRQLASAWLNTSVNEDADQDGMVNFEDFAFIVNRWRPALDFYFDSLGGDDSHTGTSPDQAWRSVEKFNKMTFGAGDRIYFKANCVWAGQLKPRGCGTLENPIVVDAYGDISDDTAKPRIDGNGVVKSVVSLVNVDYWEINNLQLTNLGAEPAAREAVFIRTSNYGRMNHIYCRGLYVHSVNGTEEWGGGGGFSVSQHDNAGAVSYIDDLKIENCYIKSVDGRGYFGGGGYATVGLPQGTNHILRNNYFEDIGDAAVLVCGTDGMLVDGNIVNGAMKRFEGCAMWPWGAYNTTFQFNEVFNCDNRGDGEAYDADYHCTGTVFQYNYSHDNPGGFMRVCSDDGTDPVGNVDITIRYNISINDGGLSEAVFPFWKRCDDVKIYNNFIYVPAGKTVMMVGSSVSGGTGGEHYWENNIFYVDGQARYEMKDGSTNYWNNNCFYGDHRIPALVIGGTVLTWKSGHPSGSNNLTADPQILGPKTWGPGIETVNGFRLSGLSPCISLGKTISNNGGRDFWGNTVYNGLPDIGAYEY